jgi:osmotically-inducible protein OsmY
MLNRKVVFRASVLALLLQCGAAFTASIADPADTGYSPADLQPQDANTPMHASRDNQDLEVTAQITRELQADSSLSVLAKNVRVSTNGDAVILRGAVRSNEIEQIEALAQKYSGTRQVVNQLTVDDLISAANP